MIGFFVVSKVIDFFKKGSSWEQGGGEKEPWELEDEKPRQDETYEEMRARQEREFKDWKDRQ